VRACGNSHLPPRLGGICECVSIENQAVTNSMTGRGRCGLTHAASRIVCQAQHSFFSRLTRVLPSTLIAISRYAGGDDLITGDRFRSRVVAQAMVDLAMRRGLAPPS
jgi:hypothetical protein